MHASPPAQNSSTLFQLRASAAQPARPLLSGHSVSARKLVPVYPTLPNSFLVIPCPPNALTFFVTRSMHPEPQRHTQLFMPVRGFPKGSRFPFPCRVRFLGGLFFPLFFRFNLLPALGAVLGCFAAAFVPKWSLESSKMYPKSTLFSMLCFHGFSIQFLAPADP